MGPGRYLGAQIKSAEWATDLRQRYDELRSCEPDFKDDFHAI